MKTKNEFQKITNLSLLTISSIILVALFTLISCSESPANDEKSIAAPSTIAPPPPPADNVMQEDNEEPFTVVEKMPEYPGGMDALLKYIQNNTKYPAQAKKNNIEGKVFVRFCVTTKGDIDKVSVIRGVDPLLDAEALRVIKTLSAFTPGKQNGKTVAVWMNIPIAFALQ